ncbi:protein of unknown function (plasmid) [Azospirillum lipoferum 4B]|uniref:Sulfotransferase domain-containing protein n=1 Tax=Azospirillum lipoferum (strain 4B) TaxID=862719 RepID=G7ZIX2_AZOL4|nr:protein of unknown function [Azospirillum lipoferum 4B]
MKNLVFCNLFYSGSSAIVPILEDYLRTTHVNVLNYGPESTRRLVDDPPPGPYFHWTHNNSDFFIPFFEREEVSIVFLQRDPRDVAISYLEDHIFRGIVDRAKLRETLHGLAYGNFANTIREACKWVALAQERPIKVIKFDELKQDTVGVTLDVLEFYGFTRDPELEQKIRSLYDTKYSFEAMSNRPRGSDGEMVRNRYIVRKGVSGEWRRLFSPEALESWDKELGAEIALLGYEPCLPRTVDGV